MANASVISYHTKVWLNNAVSNFYSPPRSYKKMIKDESINFNWPKMNSSCAWWPIHITGDNSKWCLKIAVTHSGDSRTLSELWICGLFGPCWLEARLPVDAQAQLLVWCPVERGARSGRPKRFSEQHLETSQRISAWKRSLLQDVPTWRIVL